VERITSGTFARMTRCLQLDDIVYLPYDSLTFEDRRLAGRRLRAQQWFLDLLPKETATALKDGSPDDVFYSFLVTMLVGFYEDHQLKHRAEPEWVVWLDDNVSRHIRREAAIAGDLLEPHTIVPAMPLSGIGFIALEDGLTEKTIRTFGLGRLQRIRQLGFLHDPVIRKGLSGVAGMGQLFAHTRYLHTHDVHVLALLMARNNSLAEDDETHLRVAALTHDALTPAGGDTIKLIAPASLDEETNYPSIFTMFPWQGLRDEYHLSEERLSAIVRNEGLLGQLLDLADKIAYVARDSSMFLGRLILGGLGLNCESFQEIRRFIDEHPEVCTLWDCITVDDGRVVIEDGERLASFLKLRALLFRNVYYAPEARFLEHLLAKVVVQYLFDKKLISVRSLLRMGDFELEAQIDRLMGEFFCSRTIGLDLRAFAETFDTDAQAQEREQELVRQGALTLLDRFNVVAKSGANMLVCSGGRVVPFKDAFPQDTQDIEATLRDTKQYRLYYLWPADWGPASGEAMQRIYRHHRQQVLGE